MDRKEEKILINNNNLSQLGEILKKMEPNNQYLNSTLDQINPSGRYYSSHTSQNTTISTLKQNLSYTNDSVNTTMSNYENLTSRNAPTPTMIYRKNFIKP